MDVISITCKIHNNGYRAFACELVLNCFENTSLEIQKLV